MLFWVAQVYAIIPNITIEKGAPTPMKNIPLSVYLLFLLVLLISGYKLAKKKTFHEGFLDYPIMKGIQGFAAMAVILHHVTQTVTQYGQFDKGLINIFVDAGVLFTGLFFFCSGYGLMTRLLEKEDYLNGFIKKRLPAIMVPFFVCNWLFIAVNLATGYSAKPLELVACISGIVLMNNQMWFIVELVALYVAFYLIFRKRKSDKSALIKLAIFITLMTGISLLLGHGNLSGTLGLWFHGEWWYNTTWLFFIGLIMAKYKENVVGFAKRNYSWLLPIMLLTFVIISLASTYILYSFGYYTDSYLHKLITAVVQTAMVIIFVLSFFLITMKLRFKNPVLSFLGKRTLEIYLLQNIFITKLHPIIGNDLLFYLGVYVGTIVLAIGVHWLNQRAISILSKR